MGTSWYSEKQMAKKFASESSSKVVASTTKKVAGVDYIVSVIPSASATSITYMKVVNGGNFNASCQTINLVFATGYFKANKGQIKTTLEQVNAVLATQKQNLYNESNQ
jgi:hypothetical protein